MLRSLRSSVSKHEGVSRDLWILLRDAPVRALLRVPAEGRASLPARGHRAASCRAAPRKGRNTKRTRCAPAGHRDGAEEAVRLQDRGLASVDLRGPPGMVGVVQDHVARRRRGDVDVDLGGAVARDRDPGGVCRLRRGGRAGRRSVRQQHRAARVEGGPAPVAQEGGRDRPRGRSRRTGPAAARAGSRRGSPPGSWPGA